MPLTAGFTPAMSRSTVECRRRTPGNGWETVVYPLGDAQSAPGGDRVMLTSIGLDFDLSEFYRGLDSV